MEVCEDVLDTEEEEEGLISVSFGSSKVHITPQYLHVLVSPCNTPVSGCLHLHTHWQSLQVSRDEYIYRNNVYKQHCIWKHN